MSSPHPLSPAALDALSRLAVDPLARVRWKTYSELLRAGLIEQTIADPVGGEWSYAHRVTSAGHALLEGHEG